MSSLVHLTAHPLTEDHSSSLTIGKKFLEAYRSFHPQDEVKMLNLIEAGVPLIAGRSTRSA
ncbi:hypothetical protein [Peribacillus sp. NPDC096540]|uniref:hypothetical protein n=1 Tax=Peribacillus sp. NPDC096540 TaxID=3390612 RepID=UPI003D00CBC2